MKNLKDYIEDVSTYYLRNILFEDVNEELRTLVNTKHGNNRRDQSHNMTMNISDKELEDMIKKCDDQIVNKLLNNKITINGDEMFGIRRLLNKGSLAVILLPTYFNKENFEYDVKVITRNRLDKTFKFKNNKFNFEIDKSGYVREC